MSLNQTYFEYFYIKIIQYKTFSVKQIFFNTNRKKVTTFIKKTFAKKSYKKKIILKDKKKKI